MSNAGPHNYTMRVTRTPVTGQDPEEVILLEYEFPTQSTTVAPGGLIGLKTVLGDNADVLLRMMANFLEGQ